MTKDGSYYWVLANVTPSFDENDNIVGYFSVRRKPKKESLDFIKNLYEKLLMLEKNGGMDQSLKHINNLLQEKGVSYEELILSI
jgi:hypothetical protein